MFFLLFLLGITLSFNINHHVHKSSYREVHPLLVKEELPHPPPKLKKSGKIHAYGENEYTVVSLHDDKYYDNVTWIIMINPKENKCNNLSIDLIQEKLENDGCFLYTSLFLKKNILLKIGCPSVYGNVFLKPKNSTFNGCQKVVKIRKKYYYNDLYDLLKSPLLNNTKRLLNGCYGNKNIIIEKNQAYKHPHADPGTKNLLKNYYHHKKNDTKHPFRKIEGYTPPSGRQGKPTIKSVQTNPPYNLDRLDQRFLPLDGLYNYNNGCQDVTALVLDTGILDTHSQFGGPGGRAQFVIDTTGEGATEDTNGILFIFNKIKILSSILFHKRIKCFTRFC
jgi:hypothetical protein